MLPRIGAIVAAVLMVVGAIYVRDRIDDKAVETRLTCSIELAEVCNGLADSDDVSVTIEPAGTTADRLSGLALDAEPDMDGWLTVGPWPEMVDDERRRKGGTPLFAGTDRIAGSPLVAVVEAQRAEAVRKTCGATPDWACVASLFPKAWADAGGNPVFGKVKANVPDPELHGDGLSALGAMSAAVFKDGPFSRDDDNLRQLLRNVRAAQTRTGADAVTRMLLSGGFAELDTVTTTEAATQGLLATAAGKDTVQVLYPSPVTQAVVGFGRLGDDKSATKLEGIVKGAGQRALTEAGWKGAPSVGLDPNTLAGLRALWKEAR